MCLMEIFKNLDELQSLTGKHVDLDLVKDLALPESYMPNMIDAKENAKAKHELQSHRELGL